MSVITVKRAYLELEREGVIVTQQGKGSHVASNAGLGARLREQELEQHLEQAMRIAAHAGHPAQGTGRPAARSRRPHRRKRKPYDGSRHRTERRGEEIPLLFAREHSI